MRRIFERCGGKRGLALPEDRISFYPTSLARLETRTREVSARLAIDLFGIFHGGKVRAFPSEAVKPRGQKKPLRFDTGGAKVV